MRAMLCTAVCCAAHLGLGGQCMGMMQPTCSKCLTPFQTPGSLTSSCMLPVAYDMFKGSAPVCASGLCAPGMGQLTAPLCINCAGCTAQWQAASRPHDGCRAAWRRCRGAAGGGDRLAAGGPCCRAWRWACRHILETSASAMKPGKAAAACLVLLRKSVCWPAATRIKTRWRPLQRCTCRCQLRGPELQGPEGRWPPAC